MSSAPKIWLQSRKGCVIDMVEPRADQVDFAEIADQLALLNRYAGASDLAVSVANHQLIADACAVAFGATLRQRQIVVLHDGHESRIGEVPTPSTRAKLEIGLQMFGLPFSDQLRQVLDEEKHRHDIAIHATAGIAMPEAAERLFIHRCDLAALKTERRDYLATPPMPWAPEVEAAPALPRRIKLLPPAEASLALHQLYLELLPGARAQSPRGATSTTRRSA
jgi:hypothetical protein